METNTCYYKNKQFYLLTGIILILLFCCTKKQNYQVFQTIKVDKEKRTIVFSAKLNFSFEKKFFLFYFEGYPWMKDHCIFISSSTLKELQLAIAYIDWQLWDKIYMKKFSPAVSIEFFVNNKEWKNLHEIVSLSNFDTYQTIFWGSPLYDNIVLERKYKTFVCNSCDLFSLEKEIFLKGKKILNYKFLFPLSQKDIKVRIKFL